MSNTKYEVIGLNLIPQRQDMSCWYASARMLLNWKENNQNQSSAISAPELTDAASQQVYEANNGITNPGGNQDGKGTGPGSRATHVCNHFSDWSVATTIWPTLGKRHSAYRCNCRSRWPATAGLWSVAAQPGRHRVALHADLVWRNNKRLEKGPECKYADNISALLRSYSRYRRHSFTTRLRSGLLPVL